MPLMAPAWVMVRAWSLMSSAVMVTSWVNSILALKALSPSWESGAEKNRPVS